MCLGPYKFTAALRYHFCLKNKDYCQALAQTTYEARN